MNYTSFQIATLVALSIIAVSVYAIAAAYLWRLGNPQMLQPVRVTVTHAQASGMSAIRRGVVDRTGRSYAINSQRVPLPCGVRLAPGTVVVLSHVPGSHVVAWSGA